MPAQFHARFSATHRNYIYIIDNNPTRSALFHNCVTWEHRLLNVNTMHDAAQYLVGKHNFSAFRATGCHARSPIRHVDYCNVKTVNQFVVIEIKSNAFLYHMVRNIVGSLLSVGMGYHSPEDFQRVFESRLRSEAGNTAPAYGLYLSTVDYPEIFNIPTVEHPLLSLVN